MSVVRKHHNENYTVMSNYHFKDKELSLKAKGLLSMMLSLPEDWDYSNKGLQSLCSDGGTSVRSALQELEEHNYLIRNRIYEDGIIVDWEYHIFECPDDCQTFKNSLLVGKQPKGIQTLDIQTQDSKDNKILNNKIRKNKRTKRIEEGPQKLFNPSKQSNSGPDQVVEMYNDICKELPKVRSLTPKRKTVILKVLNKYGMDTVKEVFRLTSQSDFLLGNNNRGWSADFNWLMKEDNFIKVLEGNYNKKKKEQSRDGLVTRRANREEDEAFIEKLRQEGEKVEY